MPIHKNLNWHKLSLVEQLANIGSEVSRAKRWQNKNKAAYQGAVDRALELFDFTIDDPRWLSRLKEITRAREIFCDAAFAKGEYKTSLDDLNKYFLYFGIKARRNR